MSFRRPAARIRQIDEPNPGAALSRPAGLHCGTFTGALRTRSIRKERPIQHAGYMRLVREMPCGFCGVEGLTQFCHGDQGKGMAIKTDCRTGWPGCGPRTGIPGCHHLIGTSGTYDRAERRQLETLLARRTRDLIRQRGLWPADLADWPEDDHVTTPVAPLEK